MPLWRRHSGPHDMRFLDHVPTLITSYRSSSCSSGNCWHWGFTAFDFLLAFITSFLPPSLPGFPSFSDAQTFGTQACWHTFCTPSYRALLLEVNTTKCHFEELLEISWEPIMDRKRPVGFPSPPMSGISAPGLSVNKTTKGQWKPSLGSFTTFLTSECGLWSSEPINLWQHPQNSQPKIILWEPK